LEGKLILRTVCIKDEENLIEEDFFLNDEFFRYLELDGSKIIYELEVFESHKYLNEKFRIILNCITNVKGLKSEEIF